MGHDTSSSSPDSRGDDTEFRACYPEYLAQTRERQRRFVTAFTILGLSYVAFFILSAPGANDPASIARMIAACFMTIAGIILYFLFSKTRFYLTLPFGEAPLLVLLYICQIVVIYTFLPLTRMVQSSPTDVIAYNTIVLIFMYSVLSVGEWRSFLITAIAMVAICSALIVHLDMTNTLLQTAIPVAAISHIFPVLASLGAALYANRELNDRKWQAFLYSRELDNERRKVEALLYNVLPEKIVQRLRNKETIADAFSEVSILFIDIVGFSTLATRISPRHLLEMLNQFFSTIDMLAETMAVEKVKTVGDAYIAIVGANKYHENSADGAVSFAHALLERLADFSTARRHAVKVRIGIHTGPVIGGVIGEVGMAYDFWGDSMNIASRIQTCAEPDSIYVSETTYLRCEENYSFEGPTIALLKGLGEARVYKLLPSAA